MKRTLSAFFCSVTVFAALTIPVLLSIPERPIYALTEQIPQSTAKITENDGIIYVGSGFTVTDFPKIAQKGNEVSVTVSADTDTEISISVYYASGKSEAKVFSPKTASADSDAVWEWKIPTTTSSEAVRIVLRSDSCYASFDISVF